MPDLHGRRQRVKAKGNDVLTATIAKRKTETAAKTAKKPNATFGRAMAKTLEQKMAALSPARRKKVKARTAELIEDEKSLRDLRRALALTQEKMAEEPGIGQDGDPMSDHCRGYQTSG
jgi:hypothetical protein